MLHEPDRPTAFDEPGTFVPPQDCPLDAAIAALGGKWKLALLRVLFLGGPQRYNHLLRAVPGINPKELTRNLRELEYGGLVLRGSAEASAVYGLSELGNALQPTFEALGKFGAQYRQARRSAGKPE